MKNRPVCPETFSMTAGTATRLVAKKKENKRLQEFWERGVGRTKSIAVDQKHIVGMLTRTRASKLLN